MQQPLVIARARPEQADLAYALVEEYYRQAEVVAREDRREFAREYFREEAGVWLAWLGPRLAGCAALRPLGPESAEIKRMYVREEARGRGVAQKLLEAVEAFARERGCRWTYLDTTHAMQAAARLYLRSGYRPCARYNRNPQATLFLRKRLAPEEFAPA